MWTIYIVWATQASVARKAKEKRFENKNLTIKNLELNKRTMKRTILMLLIAFGALSCSKEDIKKLEGKVDVTVYVKDNNGTPLKNWQVYAYDEWAWEHKSDSHPTFHAKQSATDDEGIASFVLSVDVIDEQEVYQFVVYYTEDNAGKKNLSGTEITKNSLKTVKTVTLKAKEKSTITITL